MCATVSKKRANTAAQSVTASLFAQQISLGMCLDLVFVTICEFLCVVGGVRCNLQTHRLMSAVDVELRTMQTKLRPWVRRAKKTSSTPAARVAWPATAVVFIDGALLSLNRGTCARESAGS